MKDYLVMKWMTYEPGSQRHIILYGLVKHFFGSAYEKNYAKSRLASLETPIFISSSNTTGLISLLERENQIAAHSMALPFEKE